MVLLAWRGKDDSGEGGASDGWEPRLQEGRRTEERRRGRRHPVHERGGAVFIALGKESNGVASINCTFPDPAANDLCFVKPVQAPCVLASTSIVGQTNHGDRRLRLAFMGGIQMRELILMAPGSAWYPGNGIRLANGVHLVVQSN